MDDINFGAPSFAKAKAILGEMNDVLKSRGLALNLAKTELMTSKQAERHFMFRENKALNRIYRREEFLKREDARENFARRIESKFRLHLSDCKARNKEKITKRYLTVLARLHYPGAATIAAQLYKDNSGLRQSISKYLTSCPFQKNIKHGILNILRSATSFDDVSRLNIVSDLVKWNIPKNRAGVLFLSEVRDILKNPSGVMAWHSWFLFLAKFGEPHECLTEFEAAKAIRRSEPFIARQAITLLCRAFELRPDKVIDLWQSEVSTSLTDSASAAANLLHFASSPFPSKSSDEYKYLFPKPAQASYPLAKYLILCVIAKTERAKGATSPRPIVNEHVSDIWMKNQLRSIQPHWF